MSLFQDFFTKIWAFITQFFGASEQAVVAGFDAAVHNVISELGQDGWQVVQDAVALAEAGGGVGTAKFDAAYAKAVADLTALGKAIVVNTVRVAIEAAVAKYRAVEAQAPAKAN